MTEQAFWFMGFGYFLLRISGLEFVTELEEINSDIHAWVDMWKLHAM
jgi:hypothetical protein